MAPNCRPSGPASTKREFGLEWIAFVPNPGEMLVGRLRASASPLAEIVDKLKTVARSDCIFADSARSERYKSLLDKGAIVRRSCRVALRHLLLV